MTCPEEGDWYKKKDKIGNDTKDLELLYEGKGQYYCQYTPLDSTEPQKYYFYVEGKACENCFELDPYLFGVVIIADVIGTAFVMIAIYQCTKKKSSPGPQTSKAPARSGGRGPPVPSPDYEQLNTQTRSQDTYSIVNRTG